MEQEKDNMFNEIDETVQESQETSTNVEGPKPDNTNENATFDLNNLPDGKKLERENMDGMTVTIKKVEIPYPRREDNNGVSTLQTARTDPTKKYYPGRMRVYFDYNDQVESVPGIKWFINKNTNDIDKPAIPKTGKTQIAKLYNMVAEQLNKPVDEVTPLNFVSFLNQGNVKVKIKWDEENDTPVNRIDEIVGTS